MIKTMKKLYWIVGAVVIGLVAGYFYPSGDADKLGGLNLPNRCVPFTQIASRSIKDNIKAAPGKVYKFSVSSKATAIKYFQLYDQVDPLGAVGLATPSFSLAIAGATSSNSPTFIQYDFPMPFAFTASGISFAISNTFASFDSTSTFYDRYFVEICYE